MGIDEGVAGLAEVVGDLALVDGLALVGGLLLVHGGDGQGGQSAPSADQREEDQLTPPLFARQKAETNLED